MPVYINAAGAFLPGEPVTNEEIATRLGPYALIVQTNRDVPRWLYGHAVVHEYIHARRLSHKERSRARVGHGSFHQLAF